MANFPYASQIYNMIPRPFRDYGDVYANAPKAAYEKKMADEKMQMDRDAAELRKQEVQTSIMDKHFNNALQLVKLAGPNAGMKYLNQYVPDHGISFEGFGTDGMYRFKSAKGNGGAGVTFPVTTSGWIPDLDKNGRVKMTNGIVTMFGPNKQRVDLKLGTPGADKWFKDNNVQNPIVGATAPATSRGNPIPIPTGEYDPISGEEINAFGLYNPDKGVMEEVPFVRRGGTAPAKTDKTTGGESPAKKTAPNFSGRGPQSLNQSYGDTPNPAPGPAGVTTIPDGARFNPEAAIRNEQIEAQGGLGRLLRPNPRSVSSPSLNDRSVLGLEQPKQSPFFGR